MYESPGEARPAIWIRLSAPTQRGHCQNQFSGHCLIVNLNCDIIIGLNSVLTLTEIKLKPLIGSVNARANALNIGDGAPTPDYAQALAFKRLP